VRGGSQPLNALVRVQMTAGVDPDCFEAYLRDEGRRRRRHGGWRGDSDFEIRLCCRSLADLRRGRSAQFRDAVVFTSTTLVAAPRPPGGVMNIWPLTAQPAVSVGGVRLEIASSSVTAVR